MKKSNWIVLGSITIVSIFLLWLWVYLGLNKVDTPLDLIVTIVWWVVIVAAAIIIHRVEQARKQRIRTMYVSDNYLFNAEAGSMNYQGPEQLVSLMDKTLNELDYNFEKKDLPDLARFPVRFIVRTSSYKQQNWKGEVVLAGDEERSVSFEDQDQLSTIINRLKAVAM